MTSTVLFKLYHLCSTLLASSKDYSIFHVCASFQTKIIVLKRAHSVVVVGHWFPVQNRLSEAKTDSIIEVTSVLGVKETCSPDLFNQF